MFLSHPTRKWNIRTCTFRILMQDENKFSIPCHYSAVLLHCFRSLEWMFWHNHFVRNTTFRLVGCEVAFYWWPIESGQPKLFFLFPRLVVAYQTYGHWRAFMSSFWLFCLRSLRSWATWSFEKVSKCYEKVDSVIISVYNPPLDAKHAFHNYK